MSTMSKVIFPHRHNATTWTDPYTGDITRLCKGECGKVLSIEWFGSNKNDKKHGRTRMCVPCHRTYCRKRAQRKALEAKAQNNG